MSVLFKVFLLIIISKLSKSLNGENCSPTDRPFAVIIIISPEPCEGALITLQTVLTTAHCLAPERINNQAIAVRAGYSLNTAYTKITYVKDVRIHEKFSREKLKSGVELRYDIGLALLNKQFTRSPLVNTVLLPSPGFTKGCMSATAVGHTSGPTRNRPMDCVDILLHTRCSEVFYSAKSSDAVFCTKGGNIEKCLGDDGGPVICNNTIIGLVSRREKRCAVSYTRIENYLKWITKQISFEYEKRSELISDHSTIEVGVWKLLLFCVVFTLM